MKKQLQQSICDPDLLRQCTAECLVQVVTTRLELLNFLFFRINMFLMFLNYFDVLILKIIF